MTQKEFLRKIYDKYGFEKDVDIFMLKLGNKQIPIVTKLGMQKIMTQEKFQYSFKAVSVSQDYAAVECEIIKEGVVLASSFGSAESANVRNKAKYFLEMAEKRAKVRSVLIAIEAHGIVYSEEEADEFKP